MLKKLPNIPGVALRQYAFRDLLAIDDGHTITGHPAVIGQETVIGDYFREVIDPGAFDGTDFTDVLFSTNHDLMKIPLARSRNNNANSTLQLLVDETGITIRASLDTENNADAKALYSAVKRGDIDGMSFIFSVSEEQWEDLDAKPPRLPLRHIQRIGRVVEVSAVNWPAYDGTDINARDRLALDSAARALESARSKAGRPEHERHAELERLRLKIHINAQKERSTI